MEAKIPPNPIPPIRQRAPTKYTRGPDIFPHSPWEIIMGPMTRSVRAISTKNQIVGFFMSMLLLSLGQLKIVYHKNAKK